VGNYGLQGFMSKTFDFQALREFQTRKTTNMKEKSRKYEKPGYVIRAEMSITNPAEAADNRSKPILSGR
jgi:hypothetical protein